MKNELIKWVEQYIDYNADIGEWDDMDGEYEIKNRKELAEQIVTRIYAVLVPDQLFDQEIDQLWDQVKLNLLPGNDDLS